MFFYRILLFAIHFKQCISVIFEYFTKYGLKFHKLCKFHGQILQFDSYIQFDTGNGFRMPKLPMLHYFVLS